MSTAILIDDILGKLPPPVKPDVVPYKGVKIYGHNTAGTIQVMDADAYSNWKGYQPGRYRAKCHQKSRR